MKISCDILIEYDNVKKTNNILKSIEVDNFDFVKTKIDRGKLEAHIDGKSVSSLLHPLDDFLSCISVAEKIVDKN